MKKFHNYILLIITICFLNISCEKSLDYQASTQPEKLVLYAFPMPDSILKVHVSKSTNILGNESFEYLNHSIIETHINNTIANISLYPDDTKWFSIDTINGETSSTYKIVCITKDEDTLSGETTIPEVVEIVNIIPSYPNEVSILDGLNNSYKFTVQFSDPLSIPNYYQLRVDLLVQDGEKVERSTISYSKDDPVFIYLDNENDFLAGIDYQGTFADDLIDGQDYDLKISIPAENIDTITNGNKELEFHLYSLTREYYTYIRSSIAADAYRNSIFHTSQNVYTNITGGIGTVAGLSVSKFNITLESNQ